MQGTQAGVKVGPMLISDFALIVVAALLVGVFVTWYRARRAGQNATIAFDMGTSALFFAVIVGRLFYVVAPPPSTAQYYSRDWYFAHPLDLLAGPVAVWFGGMGIAGVILGACLGVMLVIRSRRLDAWRWADIVLPGALAAAAILPWANLVMGQLLGPATSLPWGILETAAGASAPTYYHPTPAYMSLWAILVLVLAILARRRWGQAWPAGLWSILSWIAFLPGLFLADILRVDVSRPILGLSGAQSLSLLAEIALIVLLLTRFRARMQLTGDVTEFTEN